MRQPLARAVLVPRTAVEREALERLAAQVADELNVQRVEVVAHAGARLAYALRPNLPALGPRYGRDVGRIRAALEAADASELVGRMRAGGTLELDGFELSASDVLVDVEAAEGWSAAEDAGYSALVETVLTPALVGEGLARDYVRAIQNQRRERDLDVTDRIEVEYFGGTIERDAVERFREYIMDETLAVSLVEVDAERAGSVRTPSRKKSSNGCIRATKHGGSGSSSRGLNRLKGGRAGWPPLRGGCPTHPPF